MTRLRFVLCALFVFALISAPAQITGAASARFWMVDYFPEDFKPQFFFCSSGDTMEAEETEDGKFLLDADTNAYTWVGRRLKITAKNRSISSDKYFEGYEDDGGIHSGHPRGLNVGSSDGSVTFMETDKLDEETGRRGSSCPRKALRRCSALPI